MSIPRNLSKLADGADSSGVLSASNGGTGLTSVGTSGNVLTSNGTTWVSQAAGASLTGATQSASPFLTSLGVGAQTGATPSDYSVAIGYGAGQYVTGGSNVIIGARALNATGTGNTYRNVIIGDEAGQGLTFVAAYNTYVGRQAGQSSTQASHNTAIGQASLHDNQTGYENTAIGDGSLYAVTANNNTALGMNAGNNITTGTNNTCIGSNSSAATATASNVITLGNSSITTLRCQVTSITSLSDARDKTNVVSLNAGLSFVNKLNPVRFNWNMRDGGKVGVADSGFIAQELKSIQTETGIDIPGLVYDENPEKLEAAYGKLIPVLVKAIQELSQEVAELKTRIEVQ